MSNEEEYIADRIIADKELVKFLTEEGKIIFDIPISDFQIYSGSNLSELKPTTISGIGTELNSVIHNGVIIKITPDYEAFSLIITINSMDDGELTMTLPRTVIDAKNGEKDDDFFVLVDGGEVEFDETATSTDRTLTIQFPKGSEEIEIIGTFINTDNQKEEKTSSKNKTTKKGKPDEKKSTESKTTEEVFEKIAGSATITPDQWVIEDALGYKIYADAIYTFLINKESKPPLAISIQAPWGGGKTSIMRMVQDRLDHEGRIKTSDRINQSSISSTKVKQIRKHLEIYKKSSSFEEQYEKLKIKNEVEPYSFSKNDPDSKDPQMLTVWFNAWKYQNTEQIWAGLAHTIISQVSDRFTDPDEREEFLLELHMQRVGLEKINQKIDGHIFKEWKKRVRKWMWTYLSGIGVSLAALLMSQIEIESKKLLESFPMLDEFGISGAILSTLAGGLATFTQRIKANKEIEDQPSKNILEEFVEVPDYSTKLGFVHHADLDLQRVFKILKKKNLDLVIFIDDLDRCSPKNVAEVAETINMFLSAEYSNCYLIIGMAGELVAAAMEESYSDVIQKLPKYSKQPPVGWRFMDKFVQLPVTIPPPDLENYDVYVNSLLTQDSEKVEERTTINEIKSVIEEETQLMDIKDLRELDTMLDKVSKDLGVSNETKIRAKQELQMKRFSEKLNDTSNKMKDASDEYSDQMPEIKGIIFKSAEDFYSNPREMKRFLNVLRFHYFLRVGRINFGLPVPSLEQLRLWIIFKMKWPQVAMWIQKDSGEQKLKELEKSSKKSFDEWKNRLLELTQLSSNNKNEESDLNESQTISWIEDVNLKKFFKDKSKGSEKLSAASGTGLF